MACYRTHCYKVECDCCHTPLEFELYSSLTNHLSRETDKQISRQLERDLAQELEDRKWYSGYGVEICPSCIAKIAHEGSFAMPSGKGVLGALDRIMLSKRVVQECKRRAGGT